MSNLTLTDKQKEYIQNSNRRWNVKVGGTGTGKTWIDYHYTIPKRTKELRGKEGIYLLVGVTTSTIERNVLQPMREIYGEELVGNIVKGDSTVQLFGERYHVIGAEKESAINKIQGATVKYVYGDEFVNWNKSFFEMLTTRLRVDGSVADLTGNPQSPTHWAKKFIDDMQEEGLLYYQHSTIYDNPTLPDDFVKAQEIELKGTAGYYRYILGQWVSEEGAIYPMFTDKNIMSLEEWNKRKEEVLFVNIGVDIGGNKSKTSFQATALMQGGREIVTFKERRFEKERDIDYIIEELDKFIEEVLDEGFTIREIRVDSAEQIVIRSLRRYIRSVSPKIILNARKGKILDRIRVYQRLMNAEAYKVLETCTITQEAFRNAIWDSKTDADGKEKRLDDGTLNIDTLDAQEYSTESLHKVLIDRLGGARR